LNRTDLWRLGASLVLAIVLWGTVTAANNPERSRTFTSVDLTAAHLDNSLMIVGSLPQVSVQISGPRSDMNAIGASDIKASLDLKNVDKAGEYRLDVDVSSPGSIWRKSVTPSSVMVHVDQKASQELPVSTQVIGAVESTQQVGPVTPSVSTVTVNGPASEVSQVVKVLASIQVVNQNRDFTDTYPLVAVDADGNTLPNVVIDPPAIPISVQITARGKRLAVITQLNGDPAQGYEVVDRTINPATVLVDGPTDELDKLISVSTEPIEVTNATQTLQKHVALVGLPPDVKVIDPPDGAVDVVVQIRQRGVRQPLPSQDVAVVNVSPGLAATVSPGSVSVTVVASDAAIAKLTANDVIVQVNAEKLGPGTYSLAPIVALPANVTWVSTDPAMVTVTIRPAPSVTPAASPIPIVSPSPVPSPAATP
jgi:YbbR domain-containing protein